MKRKTIITTMALTGVLLASASVAKANAFLEILSGSASSTTTTPGPSGTLTASVGGWTAVTDYGNPSFGPFNIDVSVDNGTPAAETTPLWIVFSLSSVGGPLSGVYSLDTFTGGANVKTVNDWVYNTYYSSKLSLPPAPSGSFASQSISSPGSLNTSGTITGLTAYTEVIEVIPASSGKVTLSIDSNFGLVPDGGTTFALLGSTLVGLAGIRSKMFGKRA
jgi:hypothetical protein